jgi:predicted anti-sigma-YlaC factor YlaD
MRNCDEYKSSILDNFYNEAANIGKAEINSHMKNCPDCRKFFDDLQVMKIDLGKWESEMEVELGDLHKVVDLAVSDADRTLNDRKNIKDTIIFACICLGFFMLVYVLLIKGYGIEMLYLQASMTAILPIVLIFNIDRFREGEDNG